MVTVNRYFFDCRCHCSCVKYLDKRIPKQTSGMDSLPKISQGVLGGKGIGGEVHSQNHQVFEISDQKDWTVLGVR